MTKQQFTISIMDSGLKLERFNTVDGHIFGHFGVHKSKYGWWVLIHIPTGMYLDPAGHTWTFATARRAAKSLTGDVWGELTREDSMDRKGERMRRAREEWYAVRDALPGNVTH